MIWREWWVSNKTLHLAGFALALGVATLATASQADIAPATRSGLNVDIPLNNAAVQRLLSDAQKALNGGDTKLALILLKNAVSAMPKNGMLRLQLGLLLLRTGDAVSAERELRTARANGAPDQGVLPPLLQAMLARKEQQVLLDEFPDPGSNDHGPAVADILKARALALQELGHAAEAAATMDRALNARRDVPGILSRARLAMEQNNPTLAKNLIDEAYRLAPTNSDVLLFKITLLMQSGETSQALQYADVLIAHDPDSLSGRLARIELLIIANRDADATHDVDAILAKAPTAEIGLYYRALLMARAHNVKGAWGIAQSLSPEFVQSLPGIAFMVAQMAIGSGNSDTGAGILSKILEKSPDLVDVRLRLASVRLGQNSPETALTVLRPLFASNDTRALALIAQVYLALHQYDSALEYLTKLNATGSGGVSVKRALALTELQAGQADQGLKDLLNLADQQPTDPTVVEPLIAAMVQSAHFSEALAAAERLGKDPKQRVQSFYLRGQILLFQGHAKDALQAFEKALEIDPKHIPSLYYRASLLEDAQRYEEAAHDLQAILSLDPKNVSALIKLAEIAARQNQDGGVRSYLGRAITVAPTASAPRLALTRYLVGHNDLKGALTSVSDLLRKSPNDPDGVKLLGQIQTALGQKDQAIATFRRLSTLLPRAADPQLLLGSALLAKGDRAGAAGALSAAASVEPNSIVVRVAQINVLFAQADVNGALTLAKSFQVANPGSDADVLLADTLVRAKQPEEGLKVLAVSFNTTPNSKVLLHLAKLSAITGDKRLAEGLMEGWLNSNSKDLPVRTQYAEMLMQDGFKAKAIEQFQILVQQDPNNAPALNNLGWLLQQDDPKRGLALVERAFKLTPSSAEIVDTYGWIKLQLNDTHSAVTLLTRAHDLSPKEGEITFHLVLALNASGNHAAAKELLKALLDSAVNFTDLPNALKLSATWH